MAYKFQVGAAQLDGATTFEKALVGESTISGAAGSFDALDGTSLALQSGGITAAGAVSGVTTLGMGGALTGVTTLAASSTATIEGVVSGAAGTFDAIGGTSLALQSGGITAAGAIAGATTISGSGAISGLSLDIEKGADFNSGGLTNAGAVSGVSTLDASGLASLDGGIDVNGSNFTAGTDGAVTATSLNVQTGAITNASTLALSGLASVASISMDDGSTLGPDSVPGLWTFSADGDTTQANGAYDFDLASHDGTNGLKLGGVLVDASAADLNFTNVAAAGTAEASKALVLDSAKDLTGINNLTASYFKGNGSGITNIDVSNLDAAGSDKFVQFNQDGEFAGNAGLQYSGTGSVVVSGSSSGYQSGELAFGTSASKIGQIYAEYDDGSYVMMIKNSQGGLDMSASQGVAAYLPDDTSFTVANATNMHMKLQLMNATNQNVVAYMSGSGEISGSQSAKFKGLYVGDGNFTVSKLGALTIANSLASLDGGINVNDAYTVSTAGAVVANEFKTDGNEFVVSTAGLVTATGIANSSAGMTAVGSIAGATTVSGSGNFSIGGSLTAEHLANATVDLTADLMVIDDGASGAIKITSLANYSTAIAGAGLASTAGVLAVVNAANGGINVAANAVNIDFNDLSAAAVNVAADSLAFLDADGNVTQKESIADLATAMAGTGVTATNGVFSISSVSTPTAFGSYATLVEGLNFANVTLTGSTVLTLPALSALENGEFVKIKLAAGASATNYVTVNIGDAADEIDGATSITLESPYAAVDLYRVSADEWRVL